MNFSDGPELAAAIASVLAKDDMTDVIPGLVKLAEASINSELRVRQMLTRVTSDVASGTTYFDMPTDFLEAKRVGITSPTEYACKLGYADDDTLFETRIAYPSGAKPTLFGIVGDAIELAPAPQSDVTVELTYYASPEALDCGTVGSTNWLLAKAPDLYLYGALVHSAPYLQEDDRIQTWAALFVAKLQSLNDESRRAETSGGRLVARRTFG
jgi:hypothetical protein